MEPVGADEDHAKAAAPPTARHDLIALALIGAASAGLYALLAMRYPLLSSLADPRASWAKLVEPTWLSLGFHLAIYLALTLLYIRALRLLQTSPDQGTDRRQRWIILLAWLVGSLILLAMSPAGESHDIFDYLFRGRMMAEFGANPLVDLPIQFRWTPFFRYVGWHSHVDTYGPLWEMTSAATAIVVREALQALDWWKSSQANCPQTPEGCRTLVAYLSAYRLLAIALTGLSAALIVSLVQRNRPALTNMALAAWLWSPILLISTAVGAHNDALMLALLLFMLWLLQRQRWLLALLVVAMAAHVKLTVLPVLPVVGLWLVRQVGWRRALLLGVFAAAITVLVSWLLYAPFGGWDSLPRMVQERTLFLGNSPWRVLHTYLTAERGWTPADARRYTTQLPSVLFMASSVLMALWMLDFRPRRWKRTPAPDWRDDRLLWRATAAIFLLYLVAGSFWFQHWYVLWVLAPAALLPDSTLTRRLLPWLGFGALSANLVGDYALSALPKTQVKTGAHALIVGVIWTPLLVALARLFGERVRRRGKSTAG